MAPSKTSLLPGSTIGLAVSESQLHGTNYVTIHNSPVGGFGFSFFNHRKLQPFLDALANTKHQCCGINESRYVHAFNFLFANKMSAGKGKVFAIDQFNISIYQSHFLVGFEQRYNEATASGWAFLRILLMNLTPTTAMVATAERLYSIEEYLAMEDRNLEKSEYYDGEIIPMAGAKAVHNLITANVITALNNALDAKADTYLVLTSDTKIQVPALRSFLYPDAVVVCEALEFYDDREDIITNPLLIVEVLSPGTARYDKGRKFDYYKTLPSFQEYVLIHQRFPMVTASYKIAKRTWQDTEADSLEQTIYLRSLAVTLDVKRLYKGVTFRSAPI